MSSDPRESPKVPISLKRWFFLHFLLDILFALPLLLAPVPFLNLLGWKEVDPVAARLVAAALFGIGIESLLARNAALSSFPALLDLKLIWSTAALVGLLVSILEGVHGVPWTLWGFVVIFGAFNLLWGWWRRRVSQLLGSNDGQEKERTQ